MLLQFMSRQLWSAIRGVLIINCDQSIDSCQHIKLSSCFETLAISYIRGLVIIICSLFLMNLLLGKDTSVSSVLVPTFNHEDLLHTDFTLFECVTSHVLLHTILLCTELVGNVTPQGYK